MIKRVDSGGQVHLVTNIRKPRKWRRFEYLESSGTLYLDSGISLSLTDKFEFETEFTYSPANGVNYSFYGTGNYQTGFMALYHYTNNNLYPLYIKGLLFSPNNIVVDAESRVYSKSIIDIPNQSWTYIHNSLSSSGTYTNQITDTTSTVKIYKSTNYSAYISKCYYFKIKKNDTLVRHFVPAEYNGEYGMWDLVEDKFYRNAGTGTFTVGPEVKNYDEIDEVRKEYSILPSGVELYDYILSSGTLWIDTGYLMNGDNYEINIDALQGTISETIYGFQYTNQLCTLFLGYIYWNGSTSVGTNRAKNISNASTFTSRFALNIKANNGTINYKLNSTTGSYACGYTSFSGVQHNMHLFANNYYNNDHRYSTGKVYSFTIKLGENLVRNFLPCTYLGEPGMWDTVENKFYRNQGTGQFTLGNKITLKEYEYLEGDGSSYIDTNVVLNNTTANLFKILFDAVLTKTTLTGWRIYGYDVPNFSIGIDTYNKFCIEAGGLNRNSTNIDEYATQRMSYFVDIPNKIGTISTYLGEIVALVTPKAVNETWYNYGFRLFGTVKSNGNSGNTTCESLLYSCKMYINDILVRDFIPVSYNGTPGLWDKVEWKFYGNAGSGSFTLGPEKASGIYPVWRSINIEDTFTFKQTPNVRKTVATLLGIKGNSIAWNLGIEYATSGSFSRYRCNITASDSGYTFSSQGLNTLIVTTCPKYDSINGHKYYMMLLYKELSDLSGTIYFRNSNSTNKGTISDLVTGTIKDMKFNKFIATRNDSTTGNKAGIYYIISPALEDGLEFLYIPKNGKMSIDLTLIYGSGNEPTTVALFEADYYKWFGKPLTYESYDVGSLRCTKCTLLKSVGFNHFDGELAYGYLNPDTGLPYNSTTAYGPNYIKVIPEKSYYINTNTILNRQRFYDNDKLYLGYEGQLNNSGTLTMRSDYCYLRLMTYTQYDISEGNEFCVSFSNPNLNGIYKPYSSQTISIPITSITGKLNGSGNSVVIFPDGMKSAGTVCDEIYVENGVTKAIKRVGSVAMNTLSWERTNSNYYVYYATINNFNSNSGLYIKSICGRYESKSTYLYPSYSSLPNKGLYNYMENGVPKNKIAIADDSYTDATSFKNSLSGQLLFYLLLNPEEYIVDNFTLPILYGVELGGTEEIKSDTISVAPTLQLQYIV